MSDVVASAADAAGLDREPLLVLEPLAAFLEAAGLGAGPIDARPIGDGHSNVTYAVVRGSRRLVLRRPPRGPLAPSTHDVLREARLLSALGAGGFRVPEVLATCDDPGVIGAPFYVMAHVDGTVLTERLPAPFAGPGAPAAIADQLVDELVALHAIDVAALGLADLGRPDGYLERQVRRFRSLLERNATRELRDLDEVAVWLAANLPPGGTAALVHGDYRLGNVLYTAGSSPRLAAVLDWEMATLGDPLADVGYLTATWAQAGDPDDPMLDLSRVTRGAGFPDRAALAVRYAERSGRDLSGLGWYQVLALWKAAIFLESSYRRYRDGTTDDPYFARLADGVPVLARRAMASASRI